MGIADTWNEITDDELNEDKNKDRDSDSIPDGNYAFKVVKFDYFEGNDRREYHKFGLEVADGVMSGKYVEDFGSDNRVGIKILKTKLRMIIGRVPSLHEVYDAENNRAGDVRLECLGKVVNGKKVTTKKNGKEYMNVYFNSLSTESYAEKKTNGGGYQGPDAPPIDDADVPF
mgnify:CR=1 FL=1